jgi:hypothetical protein
VPSWPWTFATLPAGNVAASKLDDNFNAAMFAAGSSTNGQVPTWNGTTGNLLNASGYTVGTSANNLVQLDGSGLLPSGVTSALFNPASVAANGYVTMGGSGLIIQWGQITPAFYPSASVTFPVAFTTAVYSVVMTPSSLTSGASADNYVGGVSITGFTAYNQSATGTAVTAFWVAFGK